MPRTARRRPLRTDGVESIAASGSSPMVAPTADTDDPRVPDTAEQRDTRRAVARERVRRIDRQRRHRRAADHALGAPSQYPAACRYSWQPVAAELARDGWDRAYLARMVARRESGCAA